MEAREAVSFRQFRDQLRDRRQRRPQLQPGRRENSIKWICCLWLLAVKNEYRSSTCLNVERVVATIMNLFQWQVVVAEQQGWVKRLSLLRACLV